MQITAAQLNEVAALLNTADKNVVVSAVLQTLVRSGVEMNIAFDMVFGEGSYTKAAGIVYRALRGE